MTQTVAPDSPAAEQARTIHYTHVTPALKQAIQSAKAAGFADSAILNGVAAAYADFLTLTVGRDAAAKLLAAQAEHVRTSPGKEGAPGAANGNGAS